MMTAEEMIQYNILENKFISTCFDVARLIHDKDSRFPRIANWRKEGNEVIGTDTGRGYEYKFPTLFLWANEAVILEALETCPDEAYTITKITSTNI